ncbi:MAG: pyridoxamine 5'-phosphate oxidase family protein [Patescibacteria group bacterium]
MDSRILEFLKTHNVSTLTVLLSDGTPHSAVMHFSHNNDPFELYFSTKNTSKKCEALLAGGSVKASFVSGLSEGEWVTLQVDGEVKIVTEKEKIDTISEAHYTKNPSSKRYKDEPETCFLVFNPKWWRYTNFKSQPLTIISSDND